VREFFLETVKEAEIVPISDEAVQLRDAYLAAGDGMDRTVTPKLTVNYGLRWDLLIMRDFGDYSAALVDGSTMWMASEWVPVSCTSLPCAGRDDFANWGTFVARVDLDDTLDQ